MFHGTHMGFFPMGYGLLIWIIIIFVIGLLIYLLANKTSKRDSSKKKDAIEILEERFARGEISKEEFLEKKEIIKRGG